MHSSISFLKRVSLTGVDDQVAIEDLRALSHRFPFVEWAMLYVPHNEGAPRNPTRAWREAFFDAAVGGKSAVHLCGSLAFEQLLSGTLPADLLKADRIQLNINARRREFDDVQVLEVYARALELGPEIILQYHKDSIGVIEPFIEPQVLADRNRTHVLLDASKGAGIIPECWAFPSALKGHFCGFAGGLGPDNIAEVLKELECFDVPYYVDMESGIRTDNVFDLDKATRVLEKAALHLARPRR